MKIQVTQEHISRGVRASCIRCPIALAIRERVSSERLMDAGRWISDGIQVRFSTVLIGLTRLDLPWPVRDFIARFDTPNLQHMAVPFEFELPDLEGLWK